MSTWRDAWRLSVGTLTAIPVSPPTQVDRVAAGRAMLLAPVATAPLTLGWLLLGLACAWLSGSAGLAGVAGLPLVAAVCAVTVLVVGTRALHVDGLADVADGLSASFDRERSLAVMKSGDVGPSGVAAIVLTLGLQVAASATAFAQAVTTPAIVVLGWSALVLARWGLAVACLRGTPAATPGGLGAMVAGSVSPAALALATVLVVGVLAGVAAATGYPLAGVLGLLVTAAVAAASTRVVIRRARRRLGGITGDVLGAGVEISTAATLTTAALLGAFLLP